MPIYRGPGGAGDATNDATVTQVQQFATDAANSASNASTSASNAASSASSAATSASQAAASANTASGHAATAGTQATNAATSASNAASSASAASTSASNASNSASAASTSAGAAASSATTAATSATSAQNSAIAAAASATTATDAIDNALDIYGSAQDLEDAVTAAQLAESNALGYSQLAETSADSAAESASDALGYVNAAQGHATNAASSASAASVSATNAANSATSAANSAASALTIYGSTEAVNNAVANSQANRDAAAASATAASNSASASATSATASATSATAAATSAAQASAVALGNEPVRHSVRPSLLLDFANTKALDPRITFTRASTGTFYDGKTVAKAEENLLIRSEEFDNAAWTKSGCTITANSTTAPNGTTTADSLIESSGGTFHWIDYANSSLVPSGTTITVSVYLKPNGRTWAIVNLGTGQSAYFDVANGVVGTTAGTLLGTSITAVGNGWYRCVLSASTATATGRIQVYAATANGTASYSGDGTSGLFVWGAQLEQRSSVTAYTATTTAPITNYIPVLQTAASGVARFEHNPVTGESLGLEIEEQRTNLILRSEEFDNASWTKGGVSVTANAVVAPDGALTADRLVEDTSNGDHRTFQSANFTSGVAYTFTVYAKAAGRTLVQLFNGMAGGVASTFDLSAGTVAVTTGTATITAVGNGWYRCSATNTSATTGASNNQIRLVNTGTNTTYTGDGWSGVFLWGAQLEAGSFATSYIPTVASQVTRSADSASMTGTNFSSWYRESEGTVYTDFTGALGSFPPLFTIDNSSSSDANRIYVYRNSATATESTNIAYAVGSLGTFVTGSGTGKYAIAFAANNYASTVNAASPATATPNAVPAGANRLAIGGNIPNNRAMNGLIKKIAYYPRRLTNSEIQSLTTI